MHELGWFTCPSAFGATPRPALAYPCTNSLIVEPCGSHYASLKKEEEIGASHRPADPLAGRLRGSVPLFNPVYREPMALPLPEFHQSHFMFFLPLLSLLLFLSKFIRKRFPSFAFLFASHLHFVFTFFSLQERVCGGTTTPQERFCGASSPIRTILWSVITHKNNFCERQQSPTRTTNSRMADFDFY